MDLKKANSIMRENIRVNDAPIMRSVKFIDDSEYGRDGYVCFRVEDDEFNSELKKCLGSGNYYGYFMISYSETFGGYVQAEAGYDSLKKSVADIKSDGEFAASALGVDIKVATADPMHPVVIASKTGVSLNELSGALDNVIVALSMAIGKD